MEDYKAKYDQVRRVYSGEYLDEMRERIRRRYRRRLLKRRIIWAIRDAGYYGGTLLAASLLAFAYIGAIAILCGF